MTERNHVVVTHAETTVQFTFSSDHMRRPLRHRFCDVEHIFCGQEGKQLHCVSPLLLRQHGVLQTDAGAEAPERKVLFFFAQNKSTASQDSSSALLDKGGEYSSWQTDAVYWLEGTPCKSCLGVVEFSLDHEWCLGLVGGVDHWL